MVDLIEFIAGVIIAIVAVVIHMAMRWRGNVSSVAIAAKSVSQAEKLGELLIDDAEAKAGAAISAAERDADEYIEESTSGGLAGMLSRRNSRR